MFKKLVVVALAVMACVWVAKKTQVCSYASTLVAQGREHIRQQIPRELELARARNEIQNLDRDYQALFGPVAEQIATVKRHEREVTTAQVNLKEQRENLLALTRAVENNVSPVSFGGSDYTLPQAKVKLAREFASFKRQEAHLAAKEKQLEAERISLAATRSQLEALTNQKRDLEVRVEQLAAKEATLNVESVKAPLPTDNGRVAEIERTLKQIEESQEHEVELRAVQAQYGPRIGDAQPAVNGQQPSPADLQEIREYLQGQTKTASK
jgi:hypothetical protein